MVTTADCDLGEDLADVLLCRTLLLEAGCDPTIPTVDPIDYFDNERADTATFYYGDPVRERNSECEASVHTLIIIQDALRIMLNFGRYFFDLNDPVDGYTPLLYHCQGQRWNDDTVGMLLRHGADATKRNSDGQTCLHLCLSMIWVAWSNIKYGNGDRTAIRLQRALIDLVENGADVFAVDHFGKSVSDIAYAGDSKNRKLMGSMREDMWDSVLVVCGYKLSDFRRRHPRRPGYTETYTRRNFEELWKGREHFCPYYDKDGSFCFICDYDDDDGESGFKNDDHAFLCSKCAAESDWGTNDDDDDDDDDNDDDDDEVNGSNDSESEDGGANIFGT